MSVKSFVKKVARIIWPAPQIFCQITQVQDEEKFKNKVFIVTAGSGGIGKAISSKILSCGGKVVITGRDKEKVEKVASELGNNCKWIVFDVENYDGNSEFFVQCEKYFNMPINGVVSNAGGWVGIKFGNYTKNECESQFRLNMQSHFLLVQAYFRYCVSCSLQGKVVCIASNRGLIGDYMPYGMAKAGLINMVHGFGREGLRYGIRVNAIAPGMTATLVNGVDKHGDMYTSSARGHRVLMAEEMAEVAAFLLSDESKCITGALLPCDDGDSLR